jgi:hypothetical protein
MLYARAAQESCTRALHCANVQTGLTNLHPPPYRSRQIIYLSHSESVPLSLSNCSGPSLLSYTPGRAVPLHPYALAGRSSVSLTQESFPLPLRNDSGHPLSTTCRAVPLHHLHACRLSCAHLRTLCDVHGLCTSALRIDFFGILPNVSLTRWTFSSLTPGRPLLFRGHKQPVVTNFLCQS